MIVQRRCLLDGSKVKALITAFLNQNIGAVCICVEGDGRCPKDNGKPCILSLSED